MRCDEMKYGLQALPQPAMILYIIYIVRIDPNKLERIQWGFAECIPTGGIRQVTLYSTAYYLGIMMICQWGASSKSKIKLSNNMIKNR